MLKNNVVISFDAEKYHALQMQLEKQGIQLDDELISYLERLYQKHVPPDVKTYVEYMLTIKTIGK